MAPTWLRTGRGLSLTGRFEYPVIAMLHYLSTKNRVISGALIAFAVAVGGRSAAGAPAVSAGGPGHEIHIPQVGGGGRPGVDLSKAPWTQAARVTGYFELSGRWMAAHPTWAYLYYDRDGLWLGFRCEGRPSAELVAAFTERDSFVWRDDSVEFMLAPGETPDRFFHIVVNSVGAVYDAWAGDKSWNGELDIQTAKDATGWVAVVGIPFAELEQVSPRAGRAWAVNLCRNTPTAEKSSWSPTRGTLTAPDRFGRVVFGGRQTSSVRLSEVPRVGMGPNKIVLVRPVGLDFQVQGLDRDGNALFSREGQVPADGVVAYEVHSDRARRIAFTLRDTRGNLRARTWYALESPEVAARLQPLHEHFEQAMQALDTFPPVTREQARTVLAEARGRLDGAMRTVEDTASYTPQVWERLAATIRELELTLDGPLVYARTLSKLPEAEFAVGLASPMQKVMIRDFPFGGWFDDHCEVALARNEREGMQVVVMPFGRDLDEVTVSVSPLKAAGGGAAFVGGVEVSLVGHVDVVDTTPYETDYQGWYPDPLLSFQQSCPVKADEHVSFWIDVGTQRETAAGLYEGAITVQAAGCRPVTLGLRVNVWDFELPTGTHLPNAFTYSEPEVASFYRGKWNNELAYKYYDLILDHRLNVDHLYRRNSPDITMLKYAAARGQNAFNVGGVFRRTARDGSTPELDAYIDRLKREGLFGMAYVYGFDEVKAEKFAEIREVFEAVHQLYPGLKTMTTAQDWSFGAETGLRDAVDIWVPTTDQYNLAEARKLRAEGKQMWWYICVVPIHPYANWFVECPAIEARLLMGAMSYKYEVDGFLYYLISLWHGNRGPIASGPYTDWNPGSFFNEKNSKTANGDGSLICPGPNGPLATIRLKNIRDGLDDYDYLYILAETARAVRERPATAKGRAFIEQAETLLAVPDGVVRTTTDYTREPARLTTFRKEVAEAILRGRALLGS